MKFFRYTILLIISILWLGGCAQPVMHLLYQTQVIPDDYRFGDLYRLANLPSFKDPITPCPPRRNVPVNTRRVHLYLIGDSFTEPGRLSQSDLPVARYQRVVWDKQVAVQLDTTATNILLIESVERHLREHAARPIQNILVVADSNRAPVLEPKLPFTTRLTNFVRGKGMEERLETILFSHAFFLWFRELKATITLTAFDRLTPTTALSTSRQHLLLALDTDPANTLNAGTAPLTDQEVNGLVLNLNQSAGRYRAAGFDEVLLAVIPNKTTLVDPARQPYNRLVERVQTHPARQLPIIDVLTPYRQRPQSVYARGDSHWNCTGRAIWLDAVAKQLLTHKSDSRLACLPGTSGRSQ